MLHKNNVSYLCVTRIGLARHFLRVFRKFHRAVEEVLEGFILRVYIEGANSFRTTIKLWIWRLISN